MTPTTVLTWIDVLGRKDLIGGDIEFIEHGVAYRGPLAKIEINGKFIKFTLPWFARMQGDGWEKWNLSSIFVSVKVEPKDAGDRRVYFGVPFLGPCTIFPKGDVKLDPYKVKGLAPAWERLLALYPDLPFDREKVKRVLVELSFIDQGETFEQLPTDATLKDLLGKFRNDGSKEEFLWSYIEAVTGEKGVHEKVY